MSEERTESPSKRKLKKARERGEVAKSTFLSSAILFLGAILLVWGLSSLFYGGFKLSLITLLTQSELKGAFKNAFFPVLIPSLLILGGLSFLALFSHLLQTGWIWSFHKKKREKKEKRFFLPLLQLALITAVSYWALCRKFDPRLLFAGAENQLSFLFFRLLVLALILAVSLLVLGILDAFYQNARFHKQMRMTQTEKKEEQRENEGNPQIKSEIRNRKD